MKNDFLELANMLSNIFDDEFANKTKNESLTIEDYKTLLEDLNQIKDNDIAKSLFNLFNINIDELHNLIESALKEDEEEKQKVEEKKQTVKFNRPSDSLTVDQKLKIHHITEEYVNTMIRPYNNGVLTNEQINDAYAGLFEFACWIYAK